MIVVAVDFFSRGSKNSKNPGETSLTPHASIARQASFYLLVEVNPHCIDNAITTTVSSPMRSNTLPFLLLPSCQAFLSLWRQPLLRAPTPLSSSVEDEISSILRPPYEIEPVTLRIGHGFVSSTSHHGVCINNMSRVSI